MADVLRLMWRGAGCIRVYGAAAPQPAVSGRGAAVIARVRPTLTDPSRCPVPDCAGVATRRHCLPAAGARGWRPSDGVGWGTGRASAPQATRPKYCMVILPDREYTTFVRWFWSAVAVWFGYGTERSETGYCLEAVDCGVG